MILEILVLTLAIARVVVFVVNEDGPLNIMPSIRSWLKLEYYDEYGYTPTLTGNYLKDQLSEIITCPWCFGIYASLFFVGLFALFPNFAFYFALVFALSWAGPLGQKIYNLL